MVVWSGVFGREVEGDAGVGMVCSWWWSGRRMIVGAMRCEVGGDFGCSAD